MITMMALGDTDDTVLWTRTPGDRTAAAWEEAVARVMDVYEADEWEDTPAREPMSTPHKPIHLTKKVRTY
jgi:hypothetical protein